MANDTIIRITADTTSYTSELEKARRTTDAFRVFQEATEKRMQAIRTDTAGKARADLQQMGAAQLGASNSVQQYANTVKSVSENTAEFGKKAADAAREVLALTHSAVQGDWTSFASSLLSLAANAETMGLLFSAAANPIVLAATAVGTLGIAAIAGARESSILANSLQLTGNFAGITEGQFNAMAKTMSSTGNFGIGAAKDALQGLVSVGKFSGDALVEVGGAAVAMAKLSGTSAEDVIKDFSKMTDGVSKWADNFNESHHFASAAQLAHIQLLEEQGRKQEAMAETGRLVSASVSQSGENLTWVQSILRATGKAWDDFWDKAKGLGRAQTVDEQIKAITDKVTYVNRTAGGMSGISPRALAAFNANAEVQLTPLFSKKFGEEQAAKDKAQADQVQLEGRAASLRNKTLVDSQKSRPQQGEERVTQYKKDVEAQSAAGNLVVDDERQQAARIAKIRADYADKKPAQPKMQQDDAAARFIQQLRSQEAIKAQLQKNVADEKELKNKQDIQKVAERSAQINAQVASYQKSQQEQYQAEIDAVGMGGEAQKKAGAVKSINKEYEKQQQQLDGDTPQDKRNSSGYLGQKNEIQEQLKKSLKDYDKYYADLKEKQGDWRNGAMRAFYDYQDTASNVAAQSGAAFTNAAKGMEDALFNFAMTGKLSFTDLAKSIIADIARMQAKAAISGLFNFAISAIGSYFGGSSYGAVDGAQPAAGGSFTVNPQFHADGGLVSGPGTGNSDSIATWLSNGEFVNNSESTRKNRGILEWLNNGGDGSKLGSSGSGRGPAAVMANVGSASGTGLNVITNVTISDAGSSSETKGDSGAVGKQIGAMIEQTLKGLLVKELRDGGILSKTRMGYA